MDHITDHQQRAIDRLIEQYRSKESCRKVVALEAAEHQTLEDEFWAIFTDTLDAAVGEQLNAWGRLVGQARGAGWDDETYRTWIRVRLILLRGGATGDIIITVYATILAAGIDIVLREDFPAGLTVQLRGEVPTYVWPSPFTEEMPAELEFPLAIGAYLASREVLAGVLARAKAAGVRGVVEWLNAPEAETFALNVGPGLGEGMLAGGAVAR